MTLCILQITGDNGDGQLGIGCGWNYQFGDALPALEFAADFVPEFMGLGDHSCFLSTNGSMVCFGKNNNGQVRIYTLCAFLFIPCGLKSGAFLLIRQLGYGDEIDRGECGTAYQNISDLVPIDFGSDFEIAQFMIMYNHNCVLNTNDELKCWGK